MLSFDEVVTLGKPDYIRWSYKPYSNKINQLIGLMSRCRSMLKMMF